MKQSTKIMIAVSIVIIMVIVFYFVFFNSDSENTSTETAAVTDLKQQLADQLNLDIPGKWKWSNQA